MPIKARETAIEESATIWHGKKESSCDGCLPSCTRSDRSSQTATGALGPRPVSREFTTSLSATTAEQNSPRDWPDDVEAVPITLDTLSPLPTNRSKRSTNATKIETVPLSDAYLFKGAQYSGQATSKVPGRFGRQRRHPQPLKSHQFAGLSTSGVPSILPVPSRDRPRPDSSVIGGEVSYGDSAEIDDGPLETFDAYFDRNRAEADLWTAHSADPKSTPNYSRIITPTSAPRAPRASTADGNSPRLPPPALPNVRPSDFP